MSGYKRATVTISEEEYRRLHETDMKRRFREHKETTARNTAQTVELSGMLRQMEKRQRQLEQAFNDLSRDSEQDNTELINDILRHNALGYERLTAMIEEATAQSHSSLAELAHHITERMQQERTGYEQSLAALVQRQDAHEQGEQIKEEAARRWLERVALLADFLATEFNHERFLPGRLSQIQPMLCLAEGNHADGFYEASLQNSQQSFLQLSEMHFELERRIVEWQAEYQQAHYAFTEMLTKLELNERVNAFGLQGEELDVQVDVSFWTDGKYEQLLETCQQFLGVLVEEQDALSTEELQRFHCELLPAMADTFESLVYHARLQALNSQLRMNIAERALQALEVQGFSLQESGYVEEDMRAPFAAHLESPDGSRVTIQVLPTAEAAQQLASELVVITEHPYLKSEHEARLRWQELCRSLNEYQLNVSRPRVVEASRPAASYSVEPATLPHSHVIRSERL